MIPVIVKVRVQYYGVNDGFWIQRATPSFLATRDPSGVATFWRPATRATPRPRQPCPPLPDPSSSCQIRLRHKRLFGSG